MNTCKISLINTTAGKRFLVVTNSRSKEFKTKNGAIKWAIKNNYKIIEVRDLSWKLKGLCVHG